jgi:hypothetical protein
MDAEKRKNYCYLGDAVYAEFNGLGFILRTGDHREKLCSNQIFMDYETLKKFNDFIIEIKCRNHEVY